MDKLESIGEELTTTTESTTVVTTTEDETVEETITTDETECADNYTYNEETEECEFDDSIDVDEIESTKGEDSKSSGGKSGGGKSGSRGSRASDYEDESDDDDDDDDDESSEFIELESSADYLSSYYENMNWYSEDSYLEAYGGKVESEIPEITIFGSFEIRFNRPIVFP